MDVLNSLTYEVNGRIYRRNVPLDVKRISNLRGDFDLIDAFDDEYDEDVGFEGNVDNIGDEIVDENAKPSEPVMKEETPKEDDHYGIIFMKNKRAYMTDICVPELLLGRLIGAKGSTKRSLEEETGAKIDIPRKGENGPVIIASPSREAVERCYDRIEMIVLEGRRRLPFTHFVMIPIESVDFMAKHEVFVDQIRSSSQVDSSCKDAACFVSPSKLHLTIVPMWLFSEKDIKKASKVLAAAVADFKKKNEAKNLSCTIKGLSHMGDEDIDAVRVIYAKVQSESVQALADYICNAMVKAGFGEKPRGGCVKLHMTIFNTKYVAAEEKLYVDGTGLLKAFGNIEYGTTNIDKIEICQMGETDANTGKYPVIYCENL